MNNNPNPNKRRGNFKTQQRRGRGAKRQKLNHPQNITTRGRGRSSSQRGRARPRGRGKGRGRGRGRGVITRRGRGGVSLRGRGHQHQNVNVNPNQTTKITSNALSGEASLRAKLLSDKKKTKSISVSPQKPVISGAMTSDQIENQQRAKALAQKRLQNVQKAPNIARTQTTEERLKALKEAALKTIPQKAKTNQIQTETNTKQKQRNVINVSPQKGNSLKPNTTMKAPYVSSEGGIQHNIMRRNLKSYRMGPKSVDNRTLTTTLFDADHNVVKTTISTNTNTAPSKQIIHKTTGAIQNKPKPIATKKIMPKIPPNTSNINVSTQCIHKTPVVVYKIPQKRINIPPKIIPCIPSETVDKKQPETKKTVVHKAVCLPNDAKKWQCQLCTFHNVDNISMKCSMCIQVNTVKIPIPSEDNKGNKGNKVKKDKVNIETVWKQRDEAMKERAKEHKDISITKAMVESELQRKKEDIVMEAIVEEKKEVIENMKEEVVVVPKAPLPSLKDCWRLNVKQEINVNDKELKVFLEETDAFIDRMNVDLKVECREASVEYMDPFRVENDYLMLDIVEQFEWTKKICKENNVSWLNNIDMNAFSTAVAQCNKW